jgi:hypothetical protein
MLEKSRISQFTSIIATRFVSSGETSVDFRRWRLRFCDFEERIWLRKALCRLIFPVPVFRKRFLAPDVDFIFGMLPVRYD